MVLIVAHYVLQQRLQRQPLAHALARTNIETSMAELCKTRFSNV
jgi:hypothetical protein